MLASVNVNSIQSKCAPDSTSVELPFATCQMQPPAHTRLAACCESLLPAKQRQSFDSITLRNSPPRLPCVSPLHPPSPRVVSRAFTSLEPHLGRITAWHCYSSDVAASCDTALGNRPAPCLSTVARNLAFATAPRNRRLIAWYTYLPPLLLSDKFARLNSAANAQTKLCFTA